jgi:hypothetical protein
MPSVIDRPHRFGAAAIVLLVTTAACPQAPEGVVECPETGGGDTGCVEPPPPPPTPTCASPTFDGLHPRATRYRCMGHAGGAIVYDQVHVEVLGIEVGGGPGSIQMEPSITAFPSRGHHVSACCHGAPEPSMIEDGACSEDCGRAACNRVLASLRTAAASADPSNGACDGHLEADERQQCRDNVHDSLESWIAQLETRYDECVAAAVANGDGTLAFEDPGTPFGDARKLAFEDHGCDMEQTGCLFMAELRPFCEIDGHLELQSECAAAGSPEDPAADGEEG